MSGQRPRRPRWPPIVNAMAVAQELASKIDPADLAQIIETITVAAKALREGVATHLQWSVVAGSIDMAQAIERMGVVRGMHEHLTTAETALKSIHARATAFGWKPTALYYVEVDAISAFVNLHAFQLRQLSLSEYKQAVASAQGRVRGSGNTITVNKIQQLSGTST